MWRARDAQIPHAHSYVRSATPVYTCVCYITVSEHTHTHTLLQTHKHIIQLLRLYEAVYTGGGLDGHLPVLAFLILPYVHKCKSVQQHIQNYVYRL